MALPVRSALMSAHLPSSNTAVFPAAYTGEVGFGELSLRRSTFVVAPLGNRVSEYVGPFPFPAGCAVLNSVVWSSQIVEPEAQAVEGTPPGPGPAGT